jgi:hypothetical protein
VLRPAERLSRAPDTMQDGQLSGQRHPCFAIARSSEYVPTADQRGLVESAAAVGLTQADIAEQLGIDERLNFPSLARAYLS